MTARVLPLPERMTPQRERSHYAVSRRPGPYVPQVVGQVVQPVPAERQHGERRPVGADARPPPLSAGHTGIQVAPGARGGRELAGDDGRVLRGIRALDGRHVLVPVGEPWLVLVEHQREPLAEEAADVADV